LFPRKSAYSIDGRVTKLVFLLSLGVWVFAGCTRGAENHHKDTLSVALGAEPVSLDPRLTTDAAGMRIAGLIFQTLVRLGPDLKPTGDLAESWRRDGRKFIFRLKPDIHFHDGRALTAEDIEYSFDQFRASGAFASTVDIVKSVKASVGPDGRLEVTIDLDHYSEAFLVTVLPIIRILPKKEAADPTFGAHPLGTGPYKFVSMDASAVRLDAVRAKTPHLVFKIVRDDFTRYQKMLNGEIDIAQAEITYDKVKDFEARPKDFQVIRYPGLAMTYISLNFKDPLLKQKAVRTALAQTLDREAILKYKLFGFATEATSLLTPDNPYYNSSLKNLPSDPTAAAAAIEKLGLKGQKLVLKTSNAPQAIDNGRVLVNQLRRTGLDIEMQSFEWATFYDDVKKGRFQMATGRWVGNVDPDIYAQVFHSRETPPGRNRGSYVNPTLDQLLESALRQEDPSKRKKSYDVVQKIVLDDLAVLPLWYDLQVAIANKRVVNYRPEQVGDFRPLVEVSKAD
jgi:peptide/nickel transport system substrate-binding protein